MKADLKQKVLILRKQGLSYNQIKESLNIPKSTLSGWLKDIKWSNKIKTKLQKSSKEYTRNRMVQMNIQKRSDLEKIYTEAENEAAKEFNELKWFPMFISGISIYWGEGDKVGKYLVRVVNVDPLLLRAFIAFLRTG